MFHPIVPDPARLRTGVGVLMLAAILFITASGAALGPPAGWQHRAVAVAGE